MSTVLQVRFPRALSASCRALLAGLLTKEPANRLGAGPDDAHEIMNHPFFASVNWADLVAKKIPPPFKPQVESETDTRYFDSEFTGESVELTPPENDSSLARIQEEQFPQFSYQVSSTHSPRPHGTRPVLYISFLRKFHNNIYYSVKKVPGKFLKNKIVIHKHIFYF